MGAHTKVAASATVALRILGYLFLRWFPAPALVPQTVLALFAVYLPSFLYSYFSDSGYTVIEDEVDITVKETTITPAPDENGSPYGDSTPEGDPSAGSVVVDEIDVQETLILAPAPLNPWRTLLLGVPSPRSAALSLLTLGINLAVTLMCVDMLYLTRYLHDAADLSFVRLGHVSHLEARFLVREPDQSQMPVTLQIRIADPQPPFDNPAWQTGGGVRWTDNTTDYTAMISVALRHTKQRRYEWQTSNGFSGSFLSPPKAGRVPELDGGKFTFLSTSCILPRFPYSLWDNSLAIPGFRTLAKVLPELNPYFMLFLGDFIYVDVPKRFGVKSEEYRLKYRQVYASPDWQSVGQNLSWVHVLDDHEIANDWSANNTGVYAAAVEPWHHYHTAANPPAARKAGFNTAVRREGATWYEFAQGPASFFLLDTRSYRSPNSMKPLDAPEKTMLGQEQLADLLAWLARPEPRGVKWKIVASSVPFTKNWPVNKMDTWGGFLAERQKVLEAMWAVAAKGTGVVILSGDRHEFAATKFPPPKNGRWSENATVYEFSVSPLNQFASPIGSYKQRDDEDVMIKYVHAGNSKFGAITIETIPDSEDSNLTYRMFSNGKEQWSMDIQSPPVPSAGSLWERIKG